MKYSSVTIQMKATEHYFSHVSVAPFLYLYKVTLTWSLWTEFQSVTISINSSLLFVIYAVQRIK